jgi:hypothetical protein
MIINQHKNIKEPIKFNNKTTVIQRSFSRESLYLIIVSNDHFHGDKISHKTGCKWTMGLSSPMSFENYMFTQLDLYVKLILSKDLWFIK